MIDIGVCAGAVRPDGAPVGTPPASRAAPGEQAFSVSSWSGAMTLSRLATPKQNLAAVRERSVPAEHPNPTALKLATR